MSRQRTANIKVAANIELIWASVINKPNSSRRLTIRTVRTLTIRLKLARHGGPK